MGLVLPPDHGDDDCDYCDNDGCDDGDVDDIGYWKNWVGSTSLLLTMVVTMVMLMLALVW